MKRSFSLLFVVLILASASLSAGIMDIRFADSQMSADGSQFCAKVQIKAQDFDLEIGSATVFFDYNAKALKNPVFNSINFNETNKCLLNGNASAYENSFNFMETGARGEGNYAILLNASNNGCPTVTKEWVDVAEFCFDVLDRNESPKLDFNMKYTAFNTVANNGDQHSFGDVIAIDMPNLNNNAIATANAGVRVYPNLTQNKVNVEYQLENDANVNITVYDMLGKVIETKKFNQNAGIYNNTFDLSQYGNGYYLIEVDNGKHKVSEKVLLAK